MIIQPIVNTAEICVQQGVHQAVICPGSRSAPITLAFARHPKMETFVFPDERSAGFFAMGLSQSSGHPVVIVCTSGTAVANLYPAIIEAFYQQVPLLIFTADRPPEWIDQRDGQTIRQQNIFHNHVLGSYQFPVSTDHEDAKWQAENMISIAILKASDAQSGQGPVHINIPIREPFYPSPEEEYHYSNDIKLIKSAKVERILNNSNTAALIEDLKKYNRILIVAGQTRISEKLKNCLNNIQRKLKWVILGDITSNIYGLDHPVTKHDIFLGDQKAPESTKPDLLITFGQGILSKNLKGYFRNERLKDHWNIGLESEVSDTFKSLTMSINVTPDYFFELAETNLTESKKSQDDFYNYWIRKELQAHTFISNFFRTEIPSEFHAVYDVLKHVPKDSHLHLANSMPVRYANLIGISNSNITVWSNRGASGIDGCISTGVGHASNSNKLNIILTGDMAFFYDRNGLWHNHIPNSLRIIILNNHGGGIFRLINGPKQLDELEEFFETRQKLNAANTARDFGMNYFNVRNIHMLPDILDQFFGTKAGPSILEIETDSENNQKVYEDFIHKAKQI